MILTAGEDYMDVSEIVPLNRTHLETVAVIKNVLIDDDILESAQEYFVIRMDIPDQPMSDMIHIVDDEDQDVVAILDSGGRFPITLLFNTNCATILF